LASFAAAPLVTLEAHPMPKNLDRTKGIPLDAVSPLARQLSDLVTQTARSAPAVEKAAVGGEVLYRMVVPAKVAAQVGKGLVQPMRAHAGGIHSALRDASGIVAQARFVPVAAEAATAGAAGGAAGTAGVAAVAGAGAVTVAAPLVLMAVAVGVSAYADHKRQQAIEHITELLEGIVAENLGAERAELNGCRDAIDKATSVLLDQGRVGASLGLDSAVHAISTATERARERLARWRKALDDLPEGPVSLDMVAKAFPGIEGPGGEFRAHLELAALAIALRRRVIVLQAVEQGQGDAGNPFENFIRCLKKDQQNIDELEAGIAGVLARLSTLELRAPSRIWEKVMTRGEVDDLMRAAYRLRELGGGLTRAAGQADVVIEIAKDADGSLLVLPARAAA
jgi:hypothetical protein